MAALESIEEVVELFLPSWAERQVDGGTHPLFFKSNAATAVADAVGDAAIEFAEMLPEESEGYGTVLVLAGKRLLTISAADDNTFEVSHLGELPCGVYEERLTIDGEVTQRTIRYTHPRLPHGPIEFNVRRSREKRYEPFRALLREWSTGESDAPL